MTDRVTIRPAGPSDGPSLHRLAALDSTSFADGPALVAEVDGELWASLPLIEAPPFADPFRPTEDLVALLEVRAAQLAAQPGEALRPRRGLTVRWPPRGWPRLGAVRS